MSTTMYLQCTDHDPPIWSDEVGQHTYDLKEIQKYVANKEIMMKVIELDLIFEGNPGWANTAAFFFRQHARCNISIIDEYHKQYPLEGTP